MSRDIKKIQSKCIQTRLTNEGQLIDYKLIYPVTQQFKWYLELEEPDENNFIERFKDKRGVEKLYYIRFSDDFKKVKHWMMLIMIKSSDYKIKEEQEKKKNLVSIFSNL
ncbi:MAG: hypothetical protein ACK52I_26605 [Pseudomonadota bacterium]|jgi:hypothetical protein